MGNIIKSDLNENNALSVRSKEDPPGIDEDIFKKSDANDNENNAAVKRLVNDSY